MKKVLKRRVLLISLGIIAGMAFLFCAANHPAVSFAAVCGIFIFLLSLHYREKVFFAFIFIYPMIPRYFAFDLGSALPLITISRLFLIYVILFDIIFNKDKFRNIKKIIFSREIKTISFSVVFLVFTVIQNYFAFPDSESLKILVSFLFEEILLGVYIFFRAGSCEDVEKAIKSFLLSAFFIAVTGVIEFVLKINVFSYMDIVKTDRQLLSSGLDERLGENRIEGPFGHPLAYCNFLLMAMPIGIYEWQISRETKAKTGYLGIILVLLMNFFLTLSRGPMLAFAIGMFFYFILTNTRTRQLLFMFACIFASALVVGMVAGILPGFVRNFFMSLLNSVLMRGGVGDFGGNADPYSYRLYLFDLAKKIVTDDYIWFGRGVSFFRMEEVYDWVPGINSMIRITSVDNYYILQYIEMGLMGIFSTLAFIFGLIYSCIRNFLKAVNTLNKEFALCFLFMVISYFISLFTVDEIGTFRFLWITTGIFMAKISVNQGEAAYSTGEPASEKLFLVKG